MDVQDVVRKAGAARAAIQIEKARRNERRLVYQEIALRIDRPLGTVQRGVGDDGQAWERTYKADYGYIPYTQGGDDEALDVYLGPDPNEPLAHWIVQRKGDGSFDEYKLMLGFPNRAMAKAMWSAHTPEKYFGGVVTTELGMVKALLGLHPGAIAKAAGGVDVTKWAAARDLDAALEVLAERRAAATSPAMETLLKAQLDTFDREYFYRCADGARAEDVFETVFATKLSTSPEDEGETQVAVLKAEERGPLRYVLGVVLAPDVTDSQDDTYDAETIRKAAWDYLAHFRNVSRQHRELVNHGVQVVESYIAPVDITFGSRVVKAGTWLMGLHVADDGLWADVLAGKFTGLSIGGVAARVPLAPDAAPAGSNATAP